MQTDSGSVKLLVNYYLELRKVDYFSESGETSRFDQKSVSQGQSVSTVSRSATLGDRQKTGVTGN